MQTRIKKYKKRTENPEERGNYTPCATQRTLKIQYRRLSISNHFILYLPSINIFPWPLIELWPTKAWTLDFGSGMKIALTVSSGFLALVNAISVAFAHRIEVVIEPQMWLCQKLSHLTGFGLPKKPEKNSSSDQVLKARENILK